MQINLKTRQLHTSAGGMSPAQQRDLNIRPCRSNLKLDSYIHQLEVWVLPNRDLKAVWYITNCDGICLFMIMIIGFYGLCLWCFTIFQLYRGDQFFIGGGNRSTLRKQTTSRKVYHIMLYRGFYVKKHSY